LDFINKVDLFKMKKHYLLIVLFQVIVALNSFGQSKSITQLSRELTDPTQFLWQIQFEDYFEALNYYEGVGNTFRLRIVMPFQPAKGIGQQIRIDQTIETKKGITGLGDLQIFDIFIPSRKSWGAWGIGPLINLPTGNHELGTGKVSLGMAAAVSVDKSSWGHWQLDVLYEYYHSIAGDPSRNDVEITYIQPSLTYHLSNGFYLETEPVIQYDFYANAWSLPIDLRFGKVYRTKSLKFNTYIEPEYTFNSKKEGVQFGIRFGYRIVL